MEFCEAKHTQPAVENVRLELLLYHPGVACKPLHFVLDKIEVTGFEPAITWSQITHDSQTSPHLVIRDEVTSSCLNSTSGSFLQKTLPKWTVWESNPPVFPACKAGACVFPQGKHNHHHAVPQPKYSATQYRYMLASDFYGIRTRLISAVTVRRPHPATPEADNNLLKCLLFESNELLLGFNQALLPS